MADVFTVETFLVDLDDTLCDTTARHQLAVDKRWDDYSMACRNDPPILFNIRMVRGLSVMYDIALWTGRQDIAKQPTVDWLAEHNVPWTSLTMRKTGDTSANAKYKQQTAAKMLASGKNITWAMDDNPNVVGPLKVLGINVLLVDRVGKAWDRSKM